MSNVTDKMTVAEFRAYMSGKPMPGKADTPVVNRKVQNAQKCERDGVAFASRIERYMYDLLTMHKIPFEFQKQYILQPGFDYHTPTGTERIRPITYTVDFYIPDADMIIDTKGIITQQGALRIKLLKKRFADLGMRPRI